MLGGQFVSRINLKLREEKGYTYGARTGFDWRRGLSPFVAAGERAHRGDGRGDPATRLAELEAIRGSRPPTDEELALAKASLTRGYPRELRDRSAGRALGCAAGAVRLPDTYFEEFVPKVSAVSGADVTAAAAQYLRPARTP